MGTIVWVKNIDSLGLCPSDPFLSWLTKPYILSHSLKLLCKSLSVELLHQKFEAARADETLCLQLTQCDPFPMVRQVFLKGDAVPWVYARVVIPFETYQAYRVQFENLHSRLLGETLLYDNPKVTRSEFEFGLLASQDPLHFTLHNALISRNISLSKVALKARRSLFFIIKCPLLVEEYFLPTLPPFPVTVRVSL